MVLVGGLAYNSGSNRLIVEVTMGFLKNLFGGKKEKKYVDKTGIYFYAQCDNCGSGVRVRADKQHDLMSSGDGYMWNKTIVDNRCFRRMQAVVQMNRSYQVTHSELSGGKFISEAEYEALLAAKAAAAKAAEAAEAAEAGGEDEGETAVD
jgi:hypothetical protein